MIIIYSDISKDKLHMFISLYYPVFLKCTDYSGAAHYIMNSFR
jgi:hypothetical protein